jgi:ankyrin repeat protein
LYVAWTKKEGRRYLKKDERNSRWREATYPEIKKVYQTFLVREREEAAIDQAQPVPDGELKAAGDLKVRKIESKEAARVHGGSQPVHGGGRDGTTGFMLADSGGEDMGSTRAVGSLDGQERVMTDSGPVDDCSMQMCEISKARSRSTAQQNGGSSIASGDESFSMKSMRSNPTETLVDLEGQTTLQIPSTSDGGQDEGVGFQMAHASDARPSNPVNPSLASVVAPVNEQEPQPIDSWPLGKMKVESTRGRSLLPAMLEEQPIQAQVPHGALADPAARAMATQHSRHFLTLPDHDIFLFGHQVHPVDARSGGSDISSLSYPSSSAKSGISLSANSSGNWRSVMSGVSVLLSDASGTRKSPMSGVSALTGSSALGGFAHMGVKDGGSRLVHGGFGPSEGRLSIPHLPNDSPEERFEDGASMSSASDIEEARAIAAANPLSKSIIDEEPIDQIKLLVRSKPELLLERDKKGNIPMHWAAACSSSVQVLEILCGASQDSLQVQNQRGELPIHMAARINSVAVLEFLHKKSPDTLLTKDAFGRVPLHHAARSNSSSESVEFLITTSPNALHEKSRLGYLPLHHTALVNPNVKVVERLYNAHEEAIHDKADFDRLPLHCAAFSNPSSEVVKLLYEKYTDAAKLKTSWGNLPLHVAAKYNQSPEVLKILAEGWREGM